VTGDRVSLHTRIWDLVRQVPPGRVVSYGQVARMVGAPTPRIVGFAMSAAPGDVPWQRVINSRGEVSRRKAGEGDRTQRALLEAEGVVFDARGRVDFGRYGWFEED
jgi:methylated-DNA-protein-cysteine methyltransferase-like protein